MTVERGEVTVRRCKRGRSDMNIRGDTCYQTVVCCREGVKPNVVVNARQVMCHLMYDRCSEPMA